MNDNQSTSDKILMAAIDLMSEKGYDGTTTKEIAAAAGVNEVTLFRHFGTKQKLLETAFHRYHYAEEMTKLFQESLKWELHTDLLLISRIYHKIMNRNRKLLYISQKGSSSLPQEIYQEAGRHPRHLRNLLTNYLTTMMEKNMVMTPNPEMTAMSFMWMNYGAFFSSLNATGASPDQSLHEFIEESVRLFARALTP
ncbi:TetR/AcrR family transcriptional regulator [Paenibacillus sedimenti]|uniref:TetR/AcrR family transcriptional regulator n=1 Tax=Paenibacillus sedimenti TaxID=2770274 RepID=A0A926QJJ7_9BACL|nr:TetR/AcrR family transcriptional regulator [Paenibacillus sedimenti]MBD0380487.1 TetR/AcrR family transcriptional regulator [Paenibacillus sedimenti]